MTVVQLQCRHEIHFSVAAPDFGDKVWCYRCDGFRLVGAPEEFRTDARMYHADWEWSSVREKSGYRGRCEAPECKTTYWKKRFNELKRIMEVHHIHYHSNSTLLPLNTGEIPNGKSGKAASQLKPNSPAPF